MAISIPSDLVLDVVRAADPVEQYNATMKLGGPADPTSALPTLGSLMAGKEDDDFSKTYASITKPAVLTDQSTSMSRYNMAPERSDIGEKFEAMLLNQFLGELIPRDSEAFFGKGTAGEIWRSMMAEQLGAQIAKTGELHLADYLKLSNTTKTDTQG